MSLKNTKVLNLLLLLLFTVLSVNLSALKLDKVIKDAGKKVEANVKKEVNKAVEEGKAKLEAELNKVVTDAIEDGNAYIEQKTGLNILEQTGTELHKEGVQPSMLLENSQVLREVTLEGNMKYNVLAEGTGNPAQSGNTVRVHYTGTFTDGTQFDSSRGRNQPFEFQLGAGRVIQGWDLGVEGMKVGEKRILFIPSELGYGARGAGNAVPPNADLIFEVELLEIK